MKWIEDRAEHFLATTQERGQIHDAEMALDAEGRILGVQDVFLHDTGAYDPYGLTVPINSQCTLLGLYVVPDYDSTFTAVFTNKPIVTPYRGAGRQHGVFVMERLLDIAARELGIDRAEIRRRNFIPPEPSPTTTRSSIRTSRRSSMTAATTRRCWRKRSSCIGYERFVREEQPRLRAAGQARRHRRGVLCRRHRHRPVRRREGAGAGKRQGQRGDRHRHAGPGALHQPSPRSSPTRSAWTCATSTW